MRVACIQMNSGEDWQANLQQAVAFAREAAEAGAKLVALPENVLAMMANADALMQLPLHDIRRAYLEAMSDIAKRHGVTILAGTLPFPVPEEERVHNRAYVVDAEGNALAYYDKIHLCDITLPDGQSLNESRRYRPGEKLALVNSPAGKIGMTICYDLRFPQLFRTLSKAGATIFAVPAAFTVPTGEAHWHVLLRARAIENGAYVLAAAQVGTHPGNRHTYGHALIVDPWGTVLADAGGEKPGIVYAEIDAGKVAEVRRKIPSLEHDRPFA